MNNTAERLGRKIRVLREHAGFTQSSVANYLKVDQNTVLLAEEGKCVLSSDMIDKLDALLGVQLLSFQESNLHTKTLSFALGTNKFNDEELEAISAVNRIALNSSFMAHLLRGDQTVSW